MKKTLRRAGLALSVLSAMLVTSFNVYADGSANIAVPDAVSVGDSITVTVNVNCDSNIGTVAANLSYDETVLEFVSSDYASGGGGELVIPAAFPDSPTGDMSLDFSFNVIDEGEASLSVNGYVFDPEGTVIAELAASNTVISGGEAVTETDTETTTETAPPEETEAPEQTTAEIVTQQTEPTIEAQAAPASGEESASAAVKQTESSSSSSQGSLEKERNDLAKKLTIPLLIILATLILALVIVTMWIRKKMKGKDK